MVTTERKIMTMKKAKTGNKNDIRHLKNYNIQQIKNSQKINHISNNDFTILN